MVTKSEARLRPLESRLAAQLGELKLAGTTLLLAVSGGTDSLAMLLAVHELSRRLGLRLVVATIDHGLRRGSAGDCRFVARLSKKLGIPCEIVKVEVGRAGGVEAAARAARYEALEAIAARHSCQAIATAHTLEDQVETVILRLARGSGTRGLRGILRRRGRVVRPLLDVSRAELAAYLRARGVKPVEDPTNASVQFDRNRVRALVLPALEEALGPSALRAFARAAQVAAEDERYLEAEASRIAERQLRRADDGEVRADAASLRDLHPALRRRVIRRAAAMLGLRLDAGHVVRVERALAAKSPARVGLPGGHELCCAYGEVRLGRPKPCEPAAFEHRIDGPGLYQSGRFRVEVAVSRKASKPTGDGIRLDPRRLHLPLWLRTRRPGDRFRPEGGHLKKLKAYLIDQKVPRPLRDGLPLLCDDSGRVLWIVGLKASDAAREGAEAAKGWNVRVDASGCPPRALDRGDGRSLRSAVATRRGSKKGKMN